MENRIYYYYYLRQAVTVSTVSPWLSVNEPDRQDWSGNYRDPTASASQVLEIRVCSIMSNLENMLTLLQTIYKSILSKL